VHTVENYVNYLAEAFLSFEVDRFSHKLKEQLKSPRKAYAYDTGLINAIKFKTGRDLGRVIENLVAVELVRRGDDFYYYRSNNGKEVDFVVKKGTKVSQLIQVCYDIDDPNTRKREVSALLRAGRDLECDNLLILTWDYALNEKHGNATIGFLPLWRWLIGQ
jgi:predicted AAA+ superfamily ATPase